MFEKEAEIKSYIQEKNETPGFFIVYAKNTGKRIENTNIFALSDCNLDSFFNFDNSIFDK